MSKKVAFCKRCKCNTEFSYLGKRKMSREEVVSKIEDTIFTFGILPFMEFICGTDERPKYWKCSKCGYISEEK